MSQAMASVALMPTDRVQTCAEIDAWPPAFAERVRDVPAWLVAQALPRQEKRLTADLRKVGLPGMIFLERRTRHYRCKGTQEFTVPLLGGYVFVAAERERRDEIFATGRACRAMPVTDVRRLGQDLDALVHLVRHAPERLRLRHHLVAGRRIQDSLGVFAGCYGVILPDEATGIDEVVVNLEFAGLSVAAPLNPWTLESAG